MKVGLRLGVAALALAGGILGQLGSSAVSIAQPPPPPPPPPPACPYAMYWDVYTLQCVPVEATVYVNPPNPVVGPAGPVGVGGVVGPVGPGPVGPGPVGPGPVGPPRR
ncbi:hypothetical protein H7J93_07285 [Mycobacterium barrassiae]|uniref:hypothetical protein n=1 Tax=Mycobacterium barrassiae TaxID=319709 RepID=UPI002265F3BC|nr:hypothetical protein [Mycobacterium barrassiae]MCV7299438.1 hypothetical protein [Mycobacterium barrassiae]